MATVLVSTRTAYMPAGAPVEGITVSLFNSLSEFLQSDETDEDGVAHLGIRADDTYEVRVSFPAGGRVVGRQSRFEITVPDTDEDVIFDVLVEVSALPTSNDSRLCKCSGTFSDMSGTPLVGVIVAFTEHETTPHVLVHAGSGSVTGIIPNHVYAKTGRDGSASVDLVRGTRYNVEVSGYAGLVWVVQIPDAAAAPLPDVVFPVQELIEYYEGDDLLAPSATPELLVNQGTTVSIKAVTVFRSGLRLQGLRGVALQPSAAGYINGVMVDGYLEITGLAPGTVTLTPEYHSYGDGYGFKAWPTAALSGALVITVIDDPDIEDPAIPEPPVGGNPPLILDGGVI